MSGQYVEMKVVTWSRESHGLFDYESKNINVSKCKVDQSCKVYRNNDNDVDLKEYKANIAQTEENQYLTSILSQQQDKPNSMYKKTLDSNKSNQKPEDSNYLIVRSLKDKEGQQKGYTLQAGDIVKLGRIEYLVVQIRDDKKTLTTPELHLSEIHNCLVVDEYDNYTGTEPKQCKICLGDTTTDDDFFITPCKCKGSCQYVHFQCLKLWVESKVSKKQLGTTASYNWNKSDCEICKTPLPKRIRHKQKEIDLVEIEKPDAPYLILQSLATDKKISKNLFVIYGIPDIQVSMGRGHNCEVRISDISVSRTHSYIKYINNKFVVTDNNSKFGTLIKLKNQLPLSSDKIAIQVGRTVLTFVLKQENQSQGKDSTNYFTNSSKFKTANLK